MDPSNGLDPSSNKGADKSVVFEAIQNIGSLEADVNNTGAITSSEEMTPDAAFMARVAAKRRSRIVRFSAISAVIIIGLVVMLLKGASHSSQDLANARTDASQRFSNTSIPLAKINGGGSLSVQNNQTLSINGQLNVNNSLVLAPTTQPNGAVTGQLYYDQTTNQLTFYNGKQFVKVVSGDLPKQTPGTSVNGATGNISTGNGIALAGNQLSNTGVLTLQGETGNITLTAGNGILVNGTTLSNSGLLSLGGQSGDITVNPNGLSVSGGTLKNTGVTSVGGQTGDLTVGAGLSASGGTLKNSGIISAVGAGTITVTNDGNGNIIIDGPNGGTGGSGTVASPGGTINKIAKFTGVQTIADSLLSDDGTTVTVSGALHVTGAATLDTPLAVTSGGTGANSSAGARTNLGAAASGVNSDITSLTGLTTALSVAQGGTGIGTLATNGVILGNGTSPLSSVVAGASGLCLMSTAGAPTWQTCAGAGGVASIDGLTGALTLANSSGSAGTITINNASAVAKGIASFNATNFLVTSGAVNTVQDIAVTSAPTFAGLTLSSPLAVSSGGTGKSSLTSNGVLIGNGSSAITSATGSTGQCLVVSAGGSPTFATCPGSGGVSSVNSATGAITIQGTAGSSVSTVGGTITINDASSSVKGLASFNGTNFTVTNGVVNTIQDITTTSAPQFGQLSIVSNQATGKMLTINNTNAAATGNLLDLQLNGISKLSVAPNGNLTTTGTISAGAINGQTISSSANFTGSLAVAGALSVNTISPTAALTVGVGGQAFTLQGNTSSVIESTNGTNTTTVGFQSPTANVNYSFAAAAAGNYNICTTAGNCVGVGGGVTTPGGTANTLAKFTGSGTIGNSIITDNGSTVTIGGTLSVNSITPTSPLTVGATSQNLTLQGAAVTLSATSLGVTNSLTFAGPSGTNKTITLPNASGTVAVSASGPLSLDASGNLTCPTCLTSGGSGGTSGVSSLNGLTGAVVLQGTDSQTFSSAGSTISVHDATSTIKGVASFNATNLTVVGGAVNTVQNIAVTSTPTFAGLNLTSALTVTNGGTGATTATGARTNLGAAASGANSDITSLTGLTTALSIVQGGTGIATTPTNGQILIGNGTGYSLNTLTAGSGVTIANTAGNITISAPGSGTCASCANASLNNLSSVAINTSLLPGVAGGANLGSATLPFGQLFLAGTSASPATNNFKITGAATGARTITLPDASGTVAVSASGYLSLSATGNLTFVGPLAVTDGGTGANSAAGARTNLGAAASGANSDITSLSGLTTALTVAQGGTGLATLTANQLLFASSSSAIGQLASGTSGNCLISNGVGAAPSFQSCPGSGGVASLDSLTGALTISNTTGAGSTITINSSKADGTTLGIAAFNATNFTDNGAGVINTVQNINSTAIPTFAGVNTNAITPSGALTIGAAAQSFTLQGSAASAITANGGGFTTTIGFSGIPTGTVTYNFDRSAAPGTYTVCTTAGNCSGAAPGASTIGALDGGTANANGATISGTTLYLQSASATFAGLVNTTAQTFTGDKTFKSTSNSASAFQVTDTSNNTLLVVDTMNKKAYLGSTGASALSTQVHIADSTAAQQTVTVGSLYATSATTLQGGTGSINLQTGSGTSTGSILLTTGNASASAAGSITLDTGTNADAAIANTPKTFESGLDNMMDGPGYGDTISSSTDTAHGGTHSLKVVSGGTAWRVTDQQPYIIPITAGHTYSFGAWIKAGSVSGNDTFTAYWSANGFGTYTGSSIVITNIADNASNWTYVSGMAAAPAGTNFLEIQIDGTTPSLGDVHYIDDVTVIDTSAVNLGTTNAEAINIGNRTMTGSITLQGGTTRETVNSAGATVRTTTNSTTAFQVQDNAETSVFNVDTTTGRVAVGGSTTATGKLTIQGSDSYSDNNALLVQNSSGITLLQARDDGYITLGSTGRTIVGYSKIGANYDTGYTSTLTTASKVTTTTAVNVTSISAYIGAIGTNDTYRLGIYDSDGASGGPGTRLAVSATGRLVANSWNSLPLSYSMLANHTYWLAFNTSANMISSNPGYNAYDTTTGAGYYYDTTGAMNPTFTESGTNTTVQKSIYATGGVNSGSAVTIGANGNVGIGNATPFYNLDVAGIGNFTGHVYSPDFDTASATPLSIGSTNATAITLGSSTGTTTQSISIGTNGSAAQTITLGSSNAGSTLTVNAASQFNNNVIIGPITGGSTNTFQVNTSVTQLLTADTLNSRVIIGAVNGCLVAQGHLCVNQTSAAAGVTNANNTLNLTTTSGGTNVVQRIIIKDTSNAQANTNYGLIIDGTGNGGITNTAAITNGILVTNPTGRGGGNLIELQAGGSDVLKITNAGATTVSGPTTTFSGGDVTISGTNTTTDSSQLSVGGTLNSSNTGSQYGIQMNTSFNPTGGSLSNIYGITSNPNISGSSYNLSSLTGVVSGISTGASYTGTITNGNQFQANDISLGSSNLVGNFTQFNASTQSSNGGNTTGTINNMQMWLQGSTAAAASGGTLNNYGARIVLGSGSGAGTTSNYGLYISGNGGSGGTGLTTNYAIYSASTAYSLLSGTLQAASLISSGNATIGTSAGSGAIFMNNGATVNSTLALGNFTFGGSIGTAATTVDIYTSISIAQTTGSQTLTLPNPTSSAVYGRMLYISNIGTADFTLSGTPINKLGQTVKAGTTVTLMWSHTNGGASWVYAGMGTSGSGNVSLTLQNVYDNSGASPLITLSSTGQALSIQDAATPLGGNLFAVQSNGGTTKYLTVTSAGATVGGTLTVSTALQAPSLDTASAGPLTLGATNATSIIFGSSTNGITFTAAGGLVASGTARHTKTIDLTAEYPGAVLDANNDSSCSSAANGTMTSGFDITNRQNYYNWTSTLTTTQCFDVVVSARLPADFNGLPSNALTVNSWASSTTDGSLNLELRDTTGAVAQNYTPITLGTASTWQTNTFDPSAFTYIPGGYITFRIRMNSQNSANVRVGNISLQYYSKF